jgi:hypothetical protein
MIGDKTTNITYLKRNQKTKRITPLERNDEMYSTIELELPHSHLANNESEILFPRVLAVLNNKKPTRTLIIPLINT